MFVREAHRLACQKKEKQGFLCVFARLFVPLRSEREKDMQQLNLPPCDLRLRVTGGRQQVFDVLRRRYVALTPEEWVRQHFVHFLTAQKGYPQGLLCNEVELRVGEKRLRCDTLLYNRELQPQMIVEYKAPEVVITQRVFDQIAAYDMLLRVDYLVVSNGMQHYCCRMDHERHRCTFLNDIPDYESL